MIWTEEKIASLRELAEMRLSTKEIAAAMGTTLDSIRSKATVAKISICGESVQPTRNILQKRIPVVVEDVGGKIGRGWAFAHRSGEIVLDGDYLDAMLEVGLLREFTIQGGKVYGLVDP